MCTGGGGGGGGARCAGVQTCSESHIVLHVLQNPMHHTGAPSTASTPCPHLSSYPAPTDLRPTPSLRHLLLRATRRRRLRAGLGGRGRLCRRQPERGGELTVIHGAEEGRRCGCVVWPRRGVGDHSHVVGVLGRVVGVGRVLKVRNVLAERRAIRSILGVLRSKLLLQPLQLGCHVSVRR